MFPAVLALILMPARSAAQRTFAVKASSACSAPVGSRPSIAGIKIKGTRASDSGDLPSLRIIDVSSGSWMSAYYDASSKQAAWSRAACFGAQLRLLEQETGEGWHGGRWASVVFTTDKSYVAPADGSNKRWTILTQADGSLSENSKDMVVVTMPHEQVHAYQSRLGAITPRWFHEGHAEWIGRNVSAIIAPVQAAARVAEYAAALEASSTPVALVDWGGIRPKREAIMRQVSPEERRRMQQDPSYFPRDGGPYRFGPGDIVSDESNTVARYQAAWQVFDRLAGNSGQIAIQQWVAALTAKPGVVSKLDIANAAGNAFHLDLAGLIG
jgi:hypothetical protein